MEVTEVLEQCSHMVHSTVQAADTHSLYVVVAVDRCSCSGTECRFSNRVMRMRVTSNIL